MTHQQKVEAFHKSQVPQVVASELNLEPVNYYKHISLKPHNIFVSLWKADVKRERTAKQKEAEKHLRIKKPITQKSKDAKKNIITACHWLEAGAKWKELINPETKESYYFKTNFITLTVPSTTGECLDSSDLQDLTPVDKNGSEIPIDKFELLEIENLIISRVTLQKCFNNWLTTMRRKFKLHNYVWSIEPQRNGQLHIHINTDTFIHLSDIRHYWNHYLRLEGLLEKYHSKFESYDPNSTDVHSIKRSDDCVGHAAKYLAKNAIFSEAFNGNLWGCSRALSPKNKVRIKLQEEAFKHFGKEMLARNFEWKPIEIEDKNTLGKQRIGSIFYLKNKEWMKITNKIVRTAYDLHIVFLNKDRGCMPIEYYQTNLFTNTKDKIPAAKKEDWEALHQEPIRVFNPNQTIINFT
jgi:hypothetical protein